MEGLIGIKAKKKGAIITIVVVAVIAIAFGGMAAYQANHFNKGVAINGVNVGGLTASQAMSKLENGKLDNTVKVGDQVIYQGKQTVSGVTAQDEPEVKAILKKQFTLIPTSKTKNYNISSNQNNQYRTTDLRNAVQQKLTAMNANRTPARDACAVLKNGTVSVEKAKDGNQYNVKAMMKEYDNQVNDDHIDLKAIIAKPVTESSQQVENEKTKLQDLANATVDYKVENQDYNLPAKQMITSAKYVNGKYQINSKALADKIDQINKSQSTLGKKFNFKTSNGNTIQVQGKTYGWAIDTKSAVASILKAYENGTKTVDAKNNIYGIGYNENGTGYGVTSNDGIGDTYAELSIADQHAWFYRDGKLVDQVDVVTGNVQSHNDTPKGVYYIMYKQSPSTLKGVGYNGQAYSCKVQYWAQFTNDGCGFHDAWWRTNWAKDAYLTQGSDGCANIRPDQAGQVYNSLSVNEPVIVY